MTLVARPDGPKRGTRCVVCTLPLVHQQEVNTAIWKPDKSRFPNYRDAGMRVANEYLLSPIADKKVLTTHAKHIERGWREPTPDDPARGREQAVFGNGYEELVEAAAVLSAAAMKQIEKRVAKGDMSDSALIAAAKLGVSARGKQHATEVAEKNPRIELTAIFALASGHLKQLPSGEAIDVTPEAVLLDEVHEERARLEAIGRGDETAAG